MHTFIADKNKLQWIIKVHVEVEKFPDFSDEYEINVLPGGSDQWRERSLRSKWITSEAEGVKSKYLVIGDGRLVVFIDT